MSGIKRWDMDGMLEYSARTGDVIGAEVRHCEMEKGDYVLYSDHEEAMSEQHASMVYEQIDLHDQIARLRTEADELRKDAERYRWLRDTPWTGDCEIAPIIQMQMNARWDEKIDEAMGAKA